MSKSKPQKAPLGDKENTVPGTSDVPGLSSRGIGGKPCYRCCANMVDIIELDVRGFLGQMLVESLDGGADGDSVLAFIPPGRPTVPVTDPKPPPPVTRVPPQVRLLPARVVPVAGVIIAGAVVIEAIAARTAALETMNAVLLALDTYFKTLRDVGDCEQCVKRNLWNQSHPQVKEATVIRRRL